MSLHTHKSITYLVYVAVIRRYFLQDTPVPGSTTHQHVSFLIGAAVARRKAYIQHFCPSNAQRDASPFTLSSLQICLEKNAQVLQSQAFWHIKQPAAGQELSLACPKEQHSLHEDEC